MHFFFWGGVDCRQLVLDRCCHMEVVAAGFEGSTCIGISGLMCMLPAFASKFVPGRRFGRQKICIYRQEHIKSTTPRMRFFRLLLGFIEHDVPTAEGFRPLLDLYVLSRSLRAG